MRRALAALLGTAAGLVLLLSIKTHAATSSPLVPRALAPQTPGPSTPAPSGHATTPAPKGTSRTRTVTGDTVDTQWGPVQVKVTMSAGRITQVTPLQLPNGNPRDIEIDNFAVPQLIQESISANSAQIDMVSGATYTSDGYIRSLQSALDKARA